MPKKIWKDTWKYKRILEILDDYWLSQPDEYKVRVQMEFIHSSGEKQRKVIQWQNPNYTDDTQKGKPRLVCMADIEEKELPKDDWWNVTNIHKKEKEN